MLANISRPKSLTPALIVSIGLTQTLLVALALVEGAIHTELARADTAKIPNFFFVDVPKAQAGAFLSFLGEQTPGAKTEHVPMMRGRIVAVKGARVETLTVADDAELAWLHSAPEPRTKLHRVELHTRAGDMTVLFVTAAIAEGAIEAARGLSHRPTVTTDAVERAAAEPHHRQLQARTESSREGSSPR